MKNLYSFSYILDDKFEVLSMPEEWRGNLHYYFDNGIEIASSISPCLSFNSVFLRGTEISCDNDIQHLLFGNLISKVNYQPQSKALRWLQLHKEVFPDSPNTSTGLGRTIKLSSNPIKKFFN